ncbi:hypothetical protein RHGRI_032605 [Rhododendron griersonianum]|uniref:MULE transposase domain-containing protein n=1 Tax=Rhododendron griersonianum TaxID=479676 RepID=A0AAV6ICE5_9ERIC|nr:hypothetical protein RHGRI_032605 [Rhododendron griersonianum]
MITLSSTVPNSVFTFLLLLNGDRESPPVPAPLLLPRTFGAFLLCSVSLVIECYYYCVFVFIQGVMERTIMFLCKYGLHILSVRLSSSGRLKDVLCSICNRWKNLTVDKFSVSYAFEDGYCALKNETDFENMLFLLISFDSINAKVDEDKHSSRVIVGNTIDEEFDDQLEEDVDRIDHKEKYCKHAETRYLTEGWADLIEGVGQDFLVVSRSLGSPQIFHICVSGERRLVSGDLVSSPTASFTSSVKNRKGNTWGFNHCRPFLCLDVTHLKGRYKGTLLAAIGKDANQCLFPIAYAIFGAENDAKGELYGDYEGSLDRLWWYVEAARATNPGSVLRLESDLVTNEFLRLFVSFDACIKGFNHCLPFLCLDATPLKGRYKGTLLAATGKDANQCLFPIAYAIFGAENDTNWAWFLGLLRSTLSPQSITFITDRNADLVNNIPVMFPDCHHAYFLYHLQCNLRDHFPGRFRKGFRNRLVELFNDCAYASSVLVYKATENFFYQFGGDKARTYIVSVPKEHWSDAYFEGNRYGEMSSSAMESFNKWILAARQLPVFHLVDELRRKIMKQMAARRLKSKK